MSNTYSKKCMDIFGKDISNLNDGLHMPFHIFSEDGLKVLRVLWQINAERIKAFFDTIKNENIEGDIAEFGVFEGNSLERIYSYSSSIGLKRDFYGFDSFEGLPEPTEFDAHPKAWHKGRFKVEFQDIYKRLKADERDNLFLVKGWYSDTLKSPELNEKIKSISYAHIDCDLYESTIDVLQFLKGRLSHGSFITFDDWLLTEELKGETKAFFEWQEEVKDIYSFEHIYTIAQGITHFRVWHKK